MRKVYGLVGHPTVGLITPHLHQAAIRSKDLETEYRLFDVDPNDEEALANFCYETDLNYLAGFGVTHPHKKSVMDYLDYFDPLAKIVGAANTVLNERSQLIGHNTEAMGAMNALREATDIIGKKALVLGAGIAARAIAYGLREFQADVFVFNRTFEKVEQMTKEFKVEAIDYDKIPEEEFDIIVNATPVGSKLYPNETLLTSDQIHPSAVVMDLSIEPLSTRLIAEAQKAGAKTVTGERMLLHSTADQFRLFFNAEPPLEAMEQALYSALEQRGS